MYRDNVCAIKMACFMVLLSANLSQSWTVKVVNLTDERITVDIHSSQSYPGWNSRCKYWPRSDSWTGCPALKECEFIGKHVNPRSSKDFKYKDVNRVCLKPCTKSVKITSPVQLSARNPLTSCSNVIVTVNQDDLKMWNIEYYDWTNDALKLIEERRQMPLKVRAIFDKFGDSPIQSLSVFRQPIRAGVRELMRIITEKQLKRMQYDDLYHTGFIVKCQNQLIMLERNETISSRVIQPSEDRQIFEKRKIKLPRTINFNDFISNAMEDDPDFWKYDPVTNNCQIFVLQCLKKNDIEVSPDLYKFIYQDAGKVLAKSKWFEGFARDITSLANRIDNIIEKAGGSAGK